MNIKRIFIALLLFTPLFANTQNWFNAIAVRYDVNEEWQECSVPVSLDIDDNWKLKVYTEVPHTIRKIKDYGNGLDDYGNTHILWGGVDENGEDCTMALTIFANENYMRLTIKFEAFEVYFILVPD